MENYVITVARGYGSGGKQIARALAKELGIPCYENQLLEMASEYSGINTALFAQVDEKLRGSYLVNKLRKIPMDEKIEPSSKKFVSDMNLFNIQAQLIRELAKTESCIIVGKCADYILRDYDNVISVYIEAPRDACIRNLQKYITLTDKKAEEAIVKTDKYRSDYYKVYAEGDWRSPANYDLILNSERVSWDGCIHMIKDYLAYKFPEKSNETNTIS